MLRYTFYAFSGTNLLTRCHSASSCFLLFLVSENLHRKYSRNWTGQKPKFLFLPCRSRSPKRVEDGHQGGHTCPRRGPDPGPRLGRVWAPRPPPDVALPPITSLRSVNPKIISLNPRKVPPRRHHRRRDFGGQKSLFWHPAGTGNCPRSHLHRLHRHLHRRC